MYGASGFPERQVIVTQPILFDRTLLRQRRSRAAAGFQESAFLKDEVAIRLIERLNEINRNFPVVADLGCHSGGLGRLMASELHPQSLISIDLSSAMARQASGYTIVASEEALPLKPAGFDLITSALSLHWVNDLPGTLSQIFQALQPDGLFLAALFGGETLFELRHCLMEAELAVTGGASPRISPFTDIKTGGALLQRAGFALPVADIERIDIEYSSPLKLLADLRAMGETNALMDRHKAPMRRAMLMQAMALYQEKFTKPGGRVAASFDVLWLTGWHPHASQQKPLKPGSGKISLADTLAPKGDRANEE